MTVNTDDTTHRPPWPAPSTIIVPGVKKPQPVTSSLLLNCFFCCNCLASCFVAGGLRVGVMHCAKEGEKCFPIEDEIEFLRYALPESHQSN